MLSEDEFFEFFCFRVEDALSSDPEQGFFKGDFGDVSFVGCVEEFAEFFCLSDVGGNEGDYPVVFPVYVEAVFYDDSFC